MSSLVSDLFINSVWRQARRLSEISRSTFAGDDDRVAEPLPPDDAVSDSGNAEQDAPERHPPPLPPQTPPLRPLDVASHNHLDGRSLESFPELELTPRDHLGFPLTPKKGRGIPEDDGMHNLRRRIQAINAREIPSSEKARLMHEAMLEGHSASHSPRGETSSSGPAAVASQTWEHTNTAGPLDSLKFWTCQFSDSSVSESFVLSVSDITPTYAPVRQPKSPGNVTPIKTPSTPPDLCPPLGCQHYERNVKLQCSTCHKWYTCRFCHDSKEDHFLIRKETKHMLCMLCGTPQKASDICIKCGGVAAQYYCNICKLWENRPSKPIYHCNDCGICRRGLGLGKDFFHCKTCRACITTSIQSSHKCIERSTDCDCPICGEYMFTSPKPVVFMNCGHSIHKRCFDQHMKVSYKCPICKKSLANMETQFRNLDVAIQSQPMPPEFRDTWAKVLCNDCSGRSTVAYHWLGLKCFICRSYNTVQLQIHGESSEQALAASESSGVATEAAPQASQDTARPAMMLAGSHARGGGPLSGRRRRSFHDVEHQHHMHDRTARSLSPLASQVDGHLAHAVAEVEWEDDMLGIWRHSSDDADDDSDDHDGFETDQDDHADMAGQDDDSEDDEEIVLIGHR